MPNEMITDEHRKRVKQALDEAQSQKGTVKSQYALVVGYLDLIAEYQAQGLELREIWETLKVAEPRLTATLSTFKIYTQRARRESEAGEKGGEHGRE